MKTVPYAYQIEGVERIEAFDGRALLADEMGLGKTLQVLLYMHRNKGVRPVVIVCPASLKWVWEREAVKHLGMRTVVLEGTKPDKPGLVSPQVLIVNYDVLHAWLPYLKKIKPKLVVADEAHYAKSPKARRTRALKALVKEAPHFIAVSGTPMTNKPAELFPVLNMLLPKRYKTFRPYGFKYCGPRRTPWGLTFDGATRVKRLHRILEARCMIRRLKKDVLKDLPSKIRTVVPIKLSKQAQAKYDEAERDIVSWLKKNYSDRTARRAMKAEALARIGHLKRLAAKLKMKQAIQWLNDLKESSGEKVLVFVIHKKRVADLKEAFGNAAVVTGEVVGKHRMAQFDRFNKNKDCQEFIGNLHAAGVGWSCHSASTTVHLELDWVPGNHTQAEDRIHGIGRGQAGVVSQAFYVVAKDTIEERLCKVLQKKQETLDKVLDGKVHEKMDLFDQLVDDLTGAIA